MSDWINQAAVKHVSNVVNQEPLLFKMWSHIQACNPGRDNPYHSNRHMFRMAGIAGALLTNDPEYKTLSEYDQYRTRMQLLIGCLWHDYGHSAGELTDRENIIIATGALETWWKDHETEMVKFLTKGLGVEMEECDIDTFSMLLLGTIVSMIECTEFPFIIEPRALMQYCIRDADLLYTFDDDTGKIVHGLYLELKRSGKLPEGFLFKDFMDKQSDFLNSCKHYTLEGNRIHKALWSQTLENQFAWAKDQGFM